LIATVFILSDYCKSDLDLPVKHLYFLTMHKTQMLQMVAEKVAACTKCKELAETRTQTVFGDGNNNSSVVFLGESPGRTEDETGYVFVGQAGKLLTNILAAFGFRREDVYILNILKCRPPDNRTPTEQEAANCRPFLDLQLKIINPKVIVCLGNVAAQNLLHIDTSISQLRGQIREYNGAKVIFTYHPAFLLRNPEEKSKVAEDMQLLLNLLRKPFPEVSQELPPNSP
jgi:DNA polymerase